MNHFFVNQCSLFSNNSFLPTDLPQLIKKCLDSIHFSSSNIAKIISHLHPSKAYGPDMLSIIRMTKLCRILICKPLSITFIDCLNEGKFPQKQKKANFIPVNKKGSKQNLQNYKPISLMSICSKIFERLIYNKMFTYFTENNFIVQNNQGLDLVTLVLTIYLLLSTKFINRFIRGLKLEGFSQIYLKLSIRYGMKVYFSN